MNDNVFRKQSLDRISSPEQLTDYIRVSNPSVWIVLFAVIILLVSVLVWSVFGALPTTLKVSAYVRNGNTVCYVDNETAVKLRAGMTVQLGKASGTIEEVSGEPVSEANLKDVFQDDDTVKSLMAGHGNYPVKVHVSGLSDGFYEAVITIDSVKPISFIWN